MFGSTQSFRRRNQGFTIIELLVVAAILSVIGLVLVETFVQSKGAVSLGTQKVEADQQCRLAIDRMVPLVMTARNVVVPGSVGTRIEFITTEDFLDPAYDPDSWVFSPIPALFTYEIFFFDSDTSDPWNPGEIRMMRDTDFFANGSNPTPPVGTFTKLAGINALNPDTTRPGIVEFQVRDMLSSNAFEVRIGVKNYVTRANGNHARVKTDHVSLVQAPATTY